jgi:methylmalonyl-CoA mutase N-terminal domain/subunit
MMETLTEQLSKDAEKIIDEIESIGGMAKAVASVCLN